MIRFHCPICGVCYEKKPSEIGGTLRCHRCKRWVIIPACEGPGIISDRPMDGAARRKEAPNGFLPFLALAVASLCWLLVAAKSQKYSSYKPHYQAWYDKLSFSERMGFVDAQEPMPELDKFLMLDQGLALAVVLSVFFTGLALMTMASDRRKDGLSFLLFALTVPLPFVAFI